MVWSRNLDLQRSIRKDCRERSVSSSTVVPTNVIRKMSRNGVTTIVVHSRAVSVTGTMSPYPVVETDTVE